MEQKIISKFKEKPKTKTAWRAMYLGVATFFIPPILGTFAAVIRPMIDPASMEGRETDYLGMFMGFSLAIFSLILSILALVTSIRAFKMGERSWVLWLGFVPAILIAIFWIMMIMGEFLFPH